MLRKRFAHFVGIRGREVPTQREQIPLNRGELAVTDPSVYLDAALARVVSMRIALSGVDVVLELVDHPAC